MQRTGCNKRMMCCQGFVFVFVRSREAGSCAREFEFRADISGDATGVSLYVYTHEDSGKCIVTVLSGKITKRNIYSLSTRLRAARVTLVPPALYTFLRRTGVLGPPQKPLDGNAMTTEDTAVRHQSCPTEMKRASDIMSTCGIMHFVQLHWFWLHETWPISSGKYSMRMQKKKTGCSFCIYLLRVGRRKK